jgi:Heavy metal binding domain
MQRGRTHKPSEEADSDASARSTSLVAAARVLLVVLATAGALFAFFLSRPPVASASLHPSYSCPMHRQVTASAPGRCPICGMALERLDERHPAIAAAAEATVRLPGTVDVVRRRIISHQVRAPAWVEPDGTIRALVYGDDVATLAPSEQGLFHAAARGASSAVVHRADVPPTPWDTSTSELEFRVAAGTPALPPGTTGWLELPPRAVSTLVIPSSAVLQSADGPFVLVLAGRGSFSRRPVRIGKTPNGLAMVLSGLREDERIVVKTAFFLDAERRLAQGADSAGP